jgi:hypothetical protein
MASCVFTRNSGNSIGKQLILLVRGSMFVEDRRQGSNRRIV